MQAQGAMKEITRYLAIGALAVAVWGCATAGPTAAEIEGFDYGPEPTRAAVESKVRAYFDVTLKDAESARYRFDPAVTKYWIKETGWATAKRSLVGWLAKVDVNAKNSYGGYTGFQRYEFLFKDGEIVSCRSERTPAWR